MTREAISHHGYTLKTNLKNCNYKIILRHLVSYWAFISLFFPLFYGIIWLKECWIRCLTPSSCNKINSSYFYLWFITYSDWRRFYVNSKFCQYGGDISHHDSTCFCVLLTVSSLAWFYVSGYGVLGCNRNYALEYPIHVTVFNIV